MTWRELLKAAVKDKGQATVARELDYSPTTLSLVLRDKYPGGTDRIEARVLAIYGVVECPFLGKAIGADRCRRISRSPVPTSNPQAIRHWSACRSCPHFQGDKP